MRSTSRVFIVVAALLLVGAGCSQQPTTSSTVSDVNNPLTKSAADDGSAVAKNPTTGIVLQAQAKEAGQVYFSWDVAEEVEKTSKYRLVSSSEENPEFTEKNYWLQVDGTKNAITWVGLPQGEWHFRICTFDTEKNLCEVYSNDVAVTVE